MVARVGVAADIVRRDGTGEWALSEALVAPRLRVYSDYISPACYLAGPVLARLRATGVHVELRAFELLPPPAPLPDFGLPAERAAWDAEVAPLAERLGLPIVRPPLGARTRKAHEAALFARARGHFDAMHAALFESYFVEGRDIGRIDELCRIAAGVGLDAAELRVVLGLDTLAPQVEAETEDAIDAGLAGAPGFVAEAPDGTARTLSGWHEFDTIRDWLHGRARRET